MLSCLTFRNRVSRQLLKYAIGTDNKGFLACNKLLNLFSGQLWTLNGVDGSTLTNKAGLWKSIDNWNLIPLEKDILNSNDTKGELDTFQIDT